MADGLRIPYENGPTPKECIEVDGYEGSVHVDVRRVCDDGLLTLSPREAKILAYALGFFADEQAARG